MRARWTSVLGCGLVLAAFTGAFGDKSVVYERKKVLGLPVNVVTADLNKENVKVTAAVARGGIGTAEAFKSLINRVHPAAAITGAFFDPRSKLPVGDIVVAGQSLCQGAVGTGVAFTHDKQVEFVPLGEGQQTKWAAYDAVVCAGPWLIREGVRTVRPWAEGYRDRSLYALRPRAAIGFTRNNKMILVTITKPCYYTHVSKVMKALGAVNALGLDGGSSTALSIRGRIINNPSRRLTNVLLVYDSTWRYEQAVTRGRLAPSVRNPEPARPGLRILPGEPPAEPPAPQEPADTPPPDAPPVEAG